VLAHAEGSGERWYSRTARGDGVFRVLVVLSHVTDPEVKTGLSRANKYVFIHVHVYVYMHVCMYLRIEAPQVMQYASYIYVHTHM
jgi:hypothetical protein